LGFGVLGGEGSGGAGEDDFERAEHARSFT